MSILLENINDAAVVIIDKNDAFCLRMNETREFSPIDTLQLVSLDKQNTFRLSFIKIMKIYQKVIFASNAQIEEVMEYGPSTMQIATNTNILLIDLLNKNFVSYANGKIMKVNGSPYLYPILFDNFPYIKEALKTIRSRLDDSVPDSGTTSVYALTAVTFVVIIIIILVALALIIGSILSAILKRYYNNN